MNKTAAPRYADSDAHIWIVERRVRAERLSTDRLTRATKALVWAMGVLALATIEWLNAFAAIQAWRYEKVEAADDELNAGQATKVTV